MASGMRRGTTNGLSGAGCGEDEKGNVGDGDGEYDCDCDCATAGPPSRGCVGWREERVEDIFVVKGQRPLSLVATALALLEGCRRGRRLDLGLRSISRLIPRSRVGRRVIAQSRVTQAAGSRDNIRVGDVHTRDRRLIVKEDIDMQK